MLRLLPVQSAQRRHRIGLALTVAELFKAWNQEAKLDYWAVGYHSIEIMNGTNGKARPNGEIL